MHNFLKKISNVLLHIRVQDFQILNRNVIFSRDSLTDAFGAKSDEGDYRKSPAPEDDMLGAGAHQRPSGK